MSMKTFVASITIIIAMGFFPWYIVVLSFITGAWYGELFLLLVVFGFLFDVLYSSSSVVYPYLYTLVSFCIAIGVYYIRTRIRV